MFATGTQDVAVAGLREPHVAFRNFAFVANFALAIESAVTPGPAGQVFVSGIIFLIDFTAVRFAVAAPFTAAEFVHGSVACSGLSQVALSHSRPWRPV